MIPREGLQPLEWVIAPAPSSLLVVSVFSTIDGGALGKIRGLDSRGGLRKSSRPTFANGLVERRTFGGVIAYLEFIETMTGHQALGFGLCEFSSARVVADRHLPEAGDEPVVARTKEFFVFRQCPGLLHLDYDPQPGTTPLSPHEFIAALRRAVPELAEVTICTKPSSSAYLYHPEGQQIVGAGGFHAFVPVTDASQIPRLGKLIVDRLWLAGNGWIKIAANGSCLDCTIVDQSVLSPERLCFVRATCEDGVEQRFPEFMIHPGAHDDLLGEMWLNDLPALSPSDESRLADMKFAARLSARPEADRIHAAWAEDRADQRCELAAAKGETVDRAEIVRSFVEQDAWVMPTDLVLYPLGLDPITAREVFADLKRWDGHRFADPFEPDYGGDPRIAMALLSRGEPRIHSHAHGGYYCFFRSEEPRLAAGALEFSDLRVKRRFEAIPAGQFASGPPPVWLVEGVLPKASLGVIFGPPGSGKSFFVFDLAARVALGLPWREKPTRQGRVVYVCAEGATGFAKRIDAYCRHHEVDFGNSFQVIGERPDLLTRDDIQDLLVILVELKPDLVIIDTLAQVMPGGDENSSSDMGKALKACDEIQRATGCMPLLVHHSGKDADKGPRGWSGLSGAADAILTITRRGEQRVAKISKMKDGEEDEEFAFKLVPVFLSDDEAGLKSSCVVGHVEAALVLSHHAQPQGPNQKSVYKAAQDLCAFRDDGASIEEILDQAVATLPFDRGSPPQKPKRDNRRGNLMRALKQLCDNGALFLIDGRIQVYDPAASSSSFS